jgi:hypothetical protein
VGLSERKRAIGCKWMFKKKKAVLKKGGKSSRLAW